ncbi:hypothetical protein [Chromobacterium phragmitis]
MPNYRRWRVPGGTYFLTFTLLERGSSLLVCAARGGEADSA